MINSLDYGDIKFSVSKKDYDRIEQKNNICINILVLKIVWFIHSM